MQYSLNSIIYFIYHSPYTNKSFNSLFKDQFSHNPPNYYTAVP